MLAYVDFESSPCIRRTLLQRTPASVTDCYIGRASARRSNSSRKPQPASCTAQEANRQESRWRGSSAHSLQVRCIRRSDASHEILHQVVIARVSPSLKIVTGYPENVRNILVAITEKSPKGAHFAIPVGTA